MTFTLNEAKREALRQSERQLEAQQSLASAADQRSLAFCAAVIVVVVLLADNLRVDGASYAEIAALTLFIVAAVLAAFSAKPTRFYASGGKAAGFRPYLSEEHCGLLLDQIAERNDEYLAANDKAIKQSALTFRSALVAAFLGILLVYLELIGLIAWMTKVAEVTP